MRRRVVGQIASLACLLTLVLAQTGVAADPAPVPLAWSEPAHVDTQPPYTQPTSLTDVSCPTTSMCAIAAGNEVLSSDDPFGGYDRWRHTKLGAGVEVQGISCPTTTDCVAVGGDFIVVLTGLGGGAPRRTVFDIEPGLGNYLAYAACPSVTYCILGDIGGRIVTSQDPLAWPPTWQVLQIGPNVSSLFCLDVSLCALTDRGTLDVMGDPGDGPPGPGESPGFVMGVSCASHTFCVTIDDDEGAMVTTDPFRGPWTATGIFGWPVCGAPSLCLVFGDGYVVSATDPHGAWTYTPIPAYGSASNGSCPSQDRCVIATTGGGISFSSDPTGDSNAWHAQQIAGTNALLSVACPTATLCVALDSAGRALTTHAPADGPAGWSAPMPIDVAGPAAKDLACPSASLCVGVDDSGGILSSTAPDGGADAWTRTAVDGSGGLAGIACPSASLCIAVDDAGDVITSTAPTGGPTAWSSASVDSAAFADVACPSTTLCVAADRAGRIATSTDPAGGAGAWHLVTASSAPLAAVDCPSAGLCVTVDDNGGVMASTAPMGGAAGWRRMQIEGVDHLHTISCPSAALCVAAGDDAVAVSTDPAAGADAWEATVVDDVATLTDISCATERLCLAVDDAGNALLGTSPSPPQPAAPAVDLAVDPGAPPPSSATVAGAVTVRRLRTLLRHALVHLGRGARIGALLAHGRYVLQLAAPIAGVVQISWYAAARETGVAKGRRTPLLVARGEASFARPQTRAVVIRLTRAGRRVLRHATHVTLSAQGTFRGARHAAARAAITLRR